MKGMAKQAYPSDLEHKHITNTCVRENLCQKLLDNNVSDTQAVHISLDTKIRHNSITTASWIINGNNKCPNSYQQRQRVSCQKMHLHRVLTFRLQLQHLNTQSSSPPRITVQNSTRSVSSVANINPTDIFHPIFYGSTINNGTFNINIHFGSNDMCASDSKRAKSTWTLYWLLLI